MRSKMEAAFDTLYMPIFFQGVPALQHMIICKMVQHTWHNELLIQMLQGKLATFLEECVYLQVTIDFRYRIMKLLWNVSWKETQMSRYIFEVGVSLSEQTKIQRNIEIYALNLTRDFSYWMTFHSIEIFHDRNLLPVVELLYSFYEFVYDAYGRIDHEKTAQNLLICIKLTPYQKFIIACMYCFEEEIKQLWPSILTQLQLGDSEMDSNRLVQYWIARMNQQNTVLLQYNPTVMFTRHSKTYSAMKYFWKNITAFDEKVNCIGSCFVYGNTCAIEQCVKYWFPKMNDDFLKCIISRYGTIIMIKLIQVCIFQKYILSFWQHTSDMFDGDQFINILEQINAKRFRDFRLICKVLWCNAPTKLKIHTLNHYKIEDSFDSLNYLIKRIYVQNPYHIGDSLILPSDCIYYPDGCKCEFDPERENCKCMTLLQ